MIYYVNLIDLQCIQVLETRVPFLDKEVIEQAFNLPLHKKLIKVIQKLF